MCVLFVRGAGGGEMCVTHFALLEVAPKLPDQRDEEVLPRVRDLLQLPRGPSRLRGPVGKGRDVSN
jgi:hypothetical protein